MKAPIDWIDYNTKQLHKVTPDGTETSYDLVEGPCGFARVSIGGVMVDTECPNLLLLANGRPAKTPKVTKKPATRAGGPKPPAEEATEEAEDLEVAGEELAPVEKKYCKLWYKNGHAFGIRQKFGSKTQVFTVGGNSCGKTKEELAVIAEEAIAMLESGDKSEEQVKIIAKDKV